MPKIEVDEEDFLRNQKLKATVEKIMADPKARVLVEQAHKLVDANAKTPTLDQQKTIIEPVSAVEKKLDDFIAAQIKSQQERDAENKRNAMQQRIDSGIAKLRQDGWTDDGIKAVEKLMEEQGILDPAIAAAYHEKQHPPQLPAVSSGATWNFAEIPKDGGNAYEKALLDTRGQNELVAEKQAMEVLNEIRGVRRG